MGYLTFPTLLPLLYSQYGSYLSDDNSSISNCLTLSSPIFFINLSNGDSSSLLDVFISPKKHKLSVVFYFTATYKTADSCQSFLCEIFRDLFLFYL